jgi:hypothetical protein
MTEGFWWASVAVATASAAAHLATMLGTRWGDRGVSTKAFLFSLMAHAAIFCGLFAVGPKLDLLAQLPDSESSQPDDQPITVRDVLTDGEPAVASTGDVPLWDKPAEPLETPQDRTERPFELPETVETPRTIEPPSPADRDVPAVTELPESPAAAPLAERGEVPEMTAERAAPLPLEEETAEARTESRPALARTDRDPADDAKDPEPVERAAPPAADRVAPELNPDRQLASLPEADSPADLPSVEEPAELPGIETATAPLDAADEPAPVVSATDEPAPDAVASSRFGPRSTRSRDFSGELPAEARGKPDGDPLASARPSTRDVGAPRIDDFRPAGSGEPELSRPAAEGPIAARGSSIPETYQLRQLEGRSDVARSHGGTEASEQAVEAALTWLANNQDTLGYWDASAHGSGKVKIDESGNDRRNPGQTADSGVTALAVLAFLGAGYTRDEGPHAETVDRALTWLVANQREDGYLGADARNFERMYCHGMATYALAEAYGMRADPSDARLRRPLEKAIAYIAAQQGEDGGWRYAPGQEGDMSMFGWQLMALRSADIAGVPVPASAKTKAIRFLKDRSRGTSGGLAGYLNDQPPTPSMTAEALFCKQVLGITRTNPASVEAVAFLLENAPRRSKLDLYYWYYGTLAMYQYGGPAWDKWNAAIRDLLVAEQVKDGDNAGSWEPRDAWGPYGGRVYSTAVATLSLEVYYRFLPLYRVGDTSQSSDGGTEPRPPRSGPNPATRSDP